MKKLKVYGGLTFAMIEGKTRQIRTVVGVHNQKQLADVMGTTLYQIQTGWVITGNEEEIRLAIGRPFTKIFMGPI